MKRIEKSLTMFREMRESIVRAVASDAVKPAIVDLDGQIRGAIWWVKEVEFHVKGGMRYR